MGIIGKTFKFVLGLGLGAALGTVGAMLAAPQSGRATRDEIQTRVNSMLEAGKSARQEREKELQDYWEQEIELRAQREADSKEKSK